MPGMAQTAFLLFSMAWLLSILSTASRSPAQPSPCSLLFSTLCSCFLHVLLIFPTTRRLAFPFSTVICLTACQILQVPAPICLCLHRQASYCLFNVSCLPSRSAQAALSCPLQAVSTGQALCLLSGAVPGNKFEYRSRAAFLLSPACLSMFNVSHSWNDLSANPSAG